MDSGGQQQLSRNNKLIFQFKGPGWKQTSDRWSRRFDGLLGLWYSQGGRLSPSGKGMKLRSFLTTVWRYRQGEGNQIVPGEGDGDRKKDDMGVACL